MSPIDGCRLRLVCCSFLTSMQPWDTTDQTILMSRLMHCVSVTRSEVLTSCFLNRNLFVYIQKFYLHAVEITYGVQLSIINPGCIYVLTTGHSICWHNHTFHCYVDDSCVCLLNTEIQVRCVYMCDYIIWWQFLQNTDRDESYFCLIVFQQTLKSIFKVPSFRMQDMSFIIT